MTFLRDALGTREYRSFLAYPPSRSDKAGLAILDGLWALCRALHTSIRTYGNLTSVVQEVVDHGRASAGILAADEADAADDRVWIRGFCDLFG